MSAGWHAVALSPMRAAIARRMVHSKQVAPHFYVSVEVDMTAVLESAARRNAGHAPDERVTVTAYLLRALAMSLASHRAFNAIWADDELRLVDAINIGVAIALDDGLIAPALLDCTDRSVAALAIGLRDLTQRARSGRLRPAEINDATFTLSNLGMYPISGFTAIITPPQVAILATARIEPRAVVIGGAVGIRPMLTATLSADHRALDGASAAAFLADLRAALEAAAEWQDPA
ncbi:MAG: 2-oxo acid dehydrogenase subunit E2 [Chloroflexi bacterium]|nr:2-oxo acid dehydrogenase subunit E2 [Chloroflexota bacterium]